MRKSDKPKFQLTLFGRGEEQIGSSPDFFLYNSETVQPIFTKFCDFNHTNKAIFQN